MLKSLGYKVVEKDNLITANKKDSKIEFAKGSNVIAINGEQQFLNFIIWEVDDIIDLVK